MPKYLNSIFDGILLVITGAAVWGIWAGVSQGFLWGWLGLPCLALIIYSAFMEPYWLVTKVYSLKLQSRAEGEYTFVFIADIHVGPYKGARYVRRLVRHILAQKPDFVVIGGDFVYDRCSDIEKLSPIADLARQLPVYAVLGDHDYESVDKCHPTALESAAHIKTRLHAWGVQVLRNRSAIWRGDVRIVGLDEIRTARAHPQETMKTKGRAFRQGDTILVSHNPDCILNPHTHGAEIILSGHTHAGQVRLPWVGPLAFVPTILGKAWDRGFFRITPNCQLYITTGVGESGPRTRLCARPEIAVFHVRH